MKKQKTRKQLINEYSKNSPNKQMWEQRAETQEKPHVLFRDAFVEDLAYEMAANLTMKNTGIFKPLFKFIESDRCHERLVNYFSSGPFATYVMEDSNSSDNIKNILSDATQLTAKLCNFNLKLETDQAKDLDSAMLKAYQESTHYKNSLLSNDNPRKVFTPICFEVLDENEDLSDNQNDQTLDEDSLKHLMDGEKSIVFSTKNDILKKYRKNQNVYCNTNQSEIGKSHSFHRDTFVQDLALEMAASLTIKKFENFEKDAIAFINDKLCKNMLTNYFSSGPFATSQIVPGYAKQYTYFVMQDAVDLAMNFLKLPDDEPVPGYSKYSYAVKDAYYESTHYRDSTLAENNPYLTHIPLDFKVFSKWVYLFAESNDEIDDKPTQNASSCNIM